ncbi:FRG domain-containing protein [Corallococcus exiguus]|uniref:FRG domain-containing protein n=1 Tax=Corallococcus exiguus TaxID=83462 RepID=UPI001561467A|nr:FRG domain-containing protein [Corallococcus exiguus]NRD65465.1 FRG domain-containing protein [Corallococcus exiguus]
MKPPNHLKRLTSNIDMTWDDSTNILSIKTPHALTQAVGYLKYALRKNGPVFFRGQDKLHPTMKPSLFREATTIRGKSGRERNIIEYIKEAQKTRAFIGKLSTDAYEPLLQHYGIKTRWIDLVDNAWTALWFACQDAYTAGPNKQYIHYRPTTREHAFIVLMQGGPESGEPSEPGFLHGKNSTIVDLRRASPSTYLRPHAQHAILMRRSKYMDIASTDLSDFVVGVIRVEAAHAKEWLGLGTLTTTHNVFPPPFYDEGYKTFLKKAPLGNLSIGSIQHIGA